jgi:hypothetical protein
MQDIIHEVTIRGSQTDQERIAGLLDSPIPASHAIPDEAMTALRAGDWAGLSMDEQDK